MIYTENYKKFSYAIINIHELPQPESINNKLIVCLTCHSPRFVNLISYFNSFLNQIKVPDYIFLTLSMDEFPNFYNTDVYKFIQAHKDIIKIAKVPYNIGVHKKWLPIAILYKNKDYILYSTDDDFIYKKNYINDSYNYLLKHPEINYFSLINNMYNTDITGPWGMIAIFRSNVINTLLNKNCSDKLSNFLSNYNYMKLHDDSYIPAMIENCTNCKKSMLTYKDIDYLVPNNYTNIRYYNEFISPEGLKENELFNKNIPLLIDIINNKKL